MFEAPKGCAVASSAARREASRDASGRVWGMPNAGGRGQCLDCPRKARVLPVALGPSSKSAGWGSWTSHGERKVLLETLKQEKKDLCKYESTRRFVNSRNHFLGSAFFGKKSVDVRLTLERDRYNMKFLRAPVIPKNTWRETPGALHAP